MRKKPKLYMAYGSNLNLYQMAYRCPTAQVAGKAVLKDYELLFRGGYEAAGFDRKVLDDAIDCAFEFAGQLERPEETEHVPEMGGWETLK